MKKLFTSLFALVLFSSMAWANWNWGQSTGCHYQSCTMSKAKYDTYQIAAYIAEQSPNNGYETELFFVVGENVNYIPTGTYTITTTATPDSGYVIGGYNNKSFHSVYCDNGNFDFHLVSGTIYVENPNNATPTYICAIYTTQEQGYMTDTLTIGTKTAETKYDITFKVEGQEDKVVSTKENTRPVYGTTDPTKASTAQYTYTFAGWKSSDDQQTYTSANLPLATKTVTYTAQFEETTRQYTVTIDNAIQNGTISVKYGETTITSGSIDVDYGATIDLTATPNEGYKFGDWNITPEENYEIPDPSFDAPKRIGMEDSESSLVVAGGDLSIEVYGNLTISATFELEAKYGVTLNATENGTISVSDGKNTYDNSELSEGESETHYFAKNTALTLTLTPKGGDYDYGEWVDEDDVAYSEESVRNITLTEDQDLYADFMKASFTLIESGVGANYNSLPYGIMIRRMTLQRTINANSWSTMCLPFDNWLEGGTHFGKIYELSGATVEGNAVNVSFVKVSSMESGVPYMYYSETKVENPVFDYVTFDEEATAGNVEKGDLTYYGVLQTPAVLPKDNKSYRYISGNKLYYPTKDISVPFDRGYFVMSKQFSAAPMRMVIENSEITDAEEQVIVETKKYIENDVLVIERNGVKYTATGEIIK